MGKGSSQIGNVQKVFVPFILFLTFHKPKTTPHTSTDTFRETAQLFKILALNFVSLLKHKKQNHEKNNSLSSSNGFCGDDFGGKQRQKLY